MEKENKYKERMEEMRELICGEATEKAKDFIKENKHRKHL